ncbi:MAG: hypothetical protein IJM54_09250 [Thermoguttaceae bacterium]|nr:hypothetical protein [Thermoguttaceae bacterium]MBR4753001.1 hypothetical protein [Thermoguttaceae bacterium]
MSEEQPTISVNNATPQNDLTTQDGRKILSFSTAGESYSIESQEQAARGRLAELQAEEEEMKLASMKRGIRITKFYP